MTEDHNKQRFCFRINRELYPCQIQLVTQHRYKDTTAKQDFSKGTFVTLKWISFSQPLHGLINRTNLINCFDQPMKWWSWIVLLYFCLGWHDRLVTIRAVSLCLTHHHYGPSALPIHLARRTQRLRCGGRRRLRPWPWRSPCAAAASWPASPSSTGCSRGTASLRDTTTTTHSIVLVHSRHISVNQPFSISPNWLGQ